MSNGLFSSISRPTKQFGNCQLWQQNFSLDCWFCYSTPLLSTAMFAICKRLWSFQMEKSNVIQICVKIEIKKQNINQSKRLIIFCIQTASILYLTVCVDFIFLFYNFGKLYLNFQSNYFFFVSQSENHTIVVSLMCVQLQFLFS